jgi:hypothetical protein
MVRRKVGQLKRARWACEAEEVDVATCLSGPGREWDRGEREMVEVEQSDHLEDRDGWDEGTEAEKWVRQSMVDYECCAGRSLDRGSGLHF